MERFRHYGAIAVLGVLCVLLGSSSRAAAEPRKVTVDEARELASLALTPEEARRPGLTFEPYMDKNYPDFISFEVLWDNPVPDGPLVVDDLSVDPQTGDVWRRAGCSVKSAALVKMQKTLRKKMGLVEKDYAKLRHDGPVC